MDVVAGHPIGVGRCLDLGGRHFLNSYNMISLLVDTK